MPRAAKKSAPKPKKLTVYEARKLGLEADRRRLESEAIVKEAEDEAARELGRKQAEEKAAAKAAAAAKRKLERERKASRNIKDPVARSEAYTERAIPPTLRDASPSKQRLGRLRELIEPETEAMVRVMVDIAKDKTVHASIRMECADRVLSRAYGKPKEHVEISDPADAAGATDEVMTLLGNIFEAVGLPPLLEAKGSPTSEPVEGSPTS